MHILPNILPHSNSVKSQFLPSDERVVEVWYDQIKEEECQKVIESMPKRIQACIKAKGRWTKY